MAVGTCPRCGRRAIQKYRCLNCGYNAYGDDEWDASSLLGDLPVGTILAAILVGLILIGVMNYVSGRNLLTPFSPLPSASSAPVEAPSAR